MPAAALDLRPLIRAGDGIVWGQACAEPTSLVTRLVEQRRDLGGVKVFRGIAVADTLRPEECDGLEITSYSGAGTNARIWDAGLLGILPEHYSRLESLIAQRRIRSDVVFVQLSPPDNAGRCSLGLTRDYLIAAMRHARVVVGEINPEVPWTNGGPHVNLSDLTAVVEAREAIASLEDAPASPAQRQVAQNVADLIDDRATLQFGVGSMPNLILGALSDRRGLGIHSGQLTDAVVDLIEGGAVTGEAKSVDRGMVVAGTVIGTRRLFDYCHRHPQILLRESSHTHNPGVLAAQQRFVSINSAFEVDLTGQINTEVASGRYLGAVGGAVDFLAAANRAQDGLPIVALPARAGHNSRIVSRLKGPTTIARNNPAVVVTEHGVADLRGRTLEERRELLLAIADPSFRDDLASAVPE